MNGAEDTDRTRAKTVRVWDLERGTTQTFDLAEPVPRGPDGPSICWLEDQFDLGDRDLYCLDLPPQ